MGTKSHDRERGPRNSTAGQDMVSGVFPADSVINLAGITFDTRLNWGDIGALVAGLAALVGIPLIYLQVRETRRAAQGEALLDLLFRLQEDRQLEGRRALYDLIGRDDLSDQELLSLADTIEPTLRLLDLIGVLLEAKAVRREPLAEGDWAPMIARCWQGGKSFVEARRRRESRPSLWKPLERLGEEALKATVENRKKDK